MPLKITCKECNEILYEGTILKTPSDIIKKYKGNCPKCNRTLERPIYEDINISPYEEPDEEEELLTDEEIIEDQYIKEPVSGNNEKGRRRSYREEVPLSEDEVFEKLIREKPEANDEESG